MRVPHVLIPFQSYTYIYIRTIIVLKTQDLNSGWANGSVMKALAMKSWSSEFGPQKPSEKPGLVAQTYSPHTGELETGGFLGRVSQGAPDLPMKG